MKYNPHPIPPPLSEKERMKELLSGNGKKSDHKREV